MAVRRSRRTPGRRLPNDFGEIVAIANHDAQSVERAARESKYEHLTAKFNFFDFPAELRLRIYRHALRSRLSEEYEDIDVVRAPVVAMVSKQMRREILPIFFAERKIEVSLVTNLGDKDKLDLLAADGALSKLSMPYNRISMDEQVDRLDISDEACTMICVAYSNRCNRWLRSRYWLQRLIREEGIEPGFRRLRLCVHPTHFHQMSTYNRSGWRLTDIATVLIDTPAAARPRPIVKLEDMGRGRSYLELSGQGYIEARVYQAVLRVVDDILASRE